MTLAWNPNPEPDVCCYIIYYGTNSRAYPYATNVGNVTTATVYGLREGVTWYFALTALNTSGLESDFSNEVTNAIPANVTNHVPRISLFADQVAVTLAPLNLPFQVSDDETPSSNLVCSASSTNRFLVNLLLGGAGTNRVLAVTPATNRVGRTLITVVVSDGAKAASTSFLYDLMGPGPPRALRRD